MAKKYIVTLTDEERAALGQIIRSGKGAARKLTRARILLKADASADCPAWNDEQVVEALDVGIATVERLRRQFVEEGFEAALSGRATTRQHEYKLDGNAEAHLVALACSEAPQGRSRWTLRLLAGKMVELEYIDAVSHETVRRVLEKNEIKPWLKKQWVIPPLANAEFVCKMEDVLDVYKRPADPIRPLVCMDEAARQLIGETRVPLAAKPGEVLREDYEYVRNGVANFFMFFAPLEGKRHVKVTERRTKKDWAAAVKDLVDVHYPRARKIVLVMDNLNTHTPSSLYEAFPPAEAKRIADKLEIHYTPKHGSWLNMAEIELGILGRQCLDRRIGQFEEFEKEVAAWQTDRNDSEAKVNWQFTTADARTKLLRLYPSMEA